LEDEGLFVALDKPAWTGTTEGLTIKVMPVLDATNQVTHMNKVEIGIIKVPTLIAVVEFAKSNQRQVLHKMPMFLQAEVGRHPDFPDRRQISANNLHVRMVIGKFAASISAPETFVRKQ
jgi:hypothetical protein